jgi:hypothetical protein
MPPLPTTGDDGRGDCLTAGYRLDHGAPPPVVVALTTTDATRRQALLPKPGLHAVDSARQVGSVVLAGLRRTFQRHNARLQPGDFIAVTPLHRHKRHRGPDSAERRQHKPHLRGPCPEPRPANAGVIRVNRDRVTHRSRCQIQRQNLRRNQTLQNRCRTRYPLPP